MNNNIPRPLKAIKVYCFECSARQYKEARLCPVQGCALRPYRFGKRPKRAE